MDNTSSQYSSFLKTKYLTLLLLTDSIQKSVLSENTDTKNKNHNIASFTICAAEGKETKEASLLLNSGSDCAVFAS